MGYVLFLFALCLCAYFYAHKRRCMRELEEYLESVKERQACLCTESDNSSKWLSELKGAHNQLIEDYRAMEKAAASETGRGEKMLSQLQEAVILIDHSGTVISSNLAATKLFGLPSEPLSTPLSIHPYIKSAEFLDYMTHIQQGGEGAQTQREIAFERDGRTRWFEVTGSSLPRETVRSDDYPSKNQRIYLFVLHDITRLKDLEGIRREFVANVSHELRTPVTVIKGFTDTLLSDHSKLSDEDREKFLYKIHRNVERLHLLLEDLLQLSRLEGDRLNLNRREIPLDSLISEACEHVQDRLTDSQKIHLDIDPAIKSVWVDELKFTQILNNLLDNAIRYAKGFKNITLSTEKKGQTLWFTVADDGQGIPAKDLPHLFERFYRVDKGRSRDNGGTGLGLSIVKHIVLMHGGEVKAESTLGEGTRISFSIPIR